MEGLPEALNYHPHRRQTTDEKPQHQRVMATIDPPQPPVFDGGNFGGLFLGQGEGNTSPENIYFI